MQRNLCFAGAVALVGLAGCKDEPAAPAGPGVPLERAPDEIAKTVCPKAWSCCNASQLMPNETAGTNEQTCEQKTAESFRRQLAVIHSSQEKKRSVYRGDRVAECLEFVRASSCDMLNTTSRFAGLGHGCDGFVEPKTANGEACSFPWECTGGLCEKAAGAPEGVCKGLPGDGEPCASGVCATGLSCDGTSKTCRVAPAPTAPQGGHCFYASACAYGARAPSAFAALAAIAALAFAARRRRKA